MYIEPVNQELDDLYRCYLTLAAIRTNVQAMYCNTGDVPKTGKAIHAMYENSKSTGSNFLVFNGSNDAHNLYFSERTNLLYRFVHDVDHALAYAIGRGTTKYEDELYLNCSLALRAYKYTVQKRSTEVALNLFFAVYHDTVGQAKFYKEHGVFLINQRKHTIELLNNCDGVKYLKHGQVRLAYQVMIGYLTECGL